MNRLYFIFFTAMVFLAFTANAFGANQTVTNNGDSGAGTLRQAIADVGDGEEIAFNLASGNETITISSELSISGKSVTINGANTAGSGTAVMVQVTTPGTGGSAFRVFKIDASGKTITISHMTVKGGDVSGSNGEGGGIYVAAGSELNLNAVTVSGSKAFQGGGLCCRGLITIEDCTFNANASTGVGGGICVRGSETFLIKNTTVSGNTVDYKWSPFGGGIFIADSISGKIINSTISDNTATGNSPVGGIEAQGRNLYLVNSIVVNNSPNDIRNMSTIYAYYSWYHNTTADAINTQASAPNVTDAYQASDLGALADNGGPTKTMAVNASGPAYKAGGFVYYNGTDGHYIQGSDSNYYKLDPSYTQFSPSDPGSDKMTADQRGVTRGAPATIGAYSEDCAPLYYMAKSAGNWNDTTIWKTSTTAGSDPNDYTTAATETPTADNCPGIIINADVTVTADVSIDQTTINAGKTLTVNNGTTLTVADGAGTDLDADGDLSVTGTLLLNSGAAVDSDGAFTSTGTISFNAASGNDDGTLNLAGASPTLGSLIKGSGTITYDGVNQTLDGQDYYNVGIQGGGVKTLSGNATVENTLTLTNGLITLGDNDLTLGATATVSGSPSAANMIVTNGTGKLKKFFSAASRSFTFPVGDNTTTAEYSTATLNFTGGTFGAGAYAAVGVKNAKQPQNISPTDYLARYWTVTQSGISAFSCDTTFNYLPTDVHGTEADIYGGQYKNSAWTVLNAVDPANHRFQATVDSFSDFTGIEVAAPATQATNISFSSVAQTQVQVSWTRGSGDKVLIVARRGSAVNSNPVNGTDYAANAAFGSGSQIGTGNYVVYKGTGTSMTVTGLTANTAYHFRAYEFNDMVDERYHTNTATDNPNNQTTLPNAPGVPVATDATSISATGFSANWNVAAGATGYWLDVSTQSDFSSYVIGYQNKAVGNVTTSAVTGLSGGTTYYYRVRAENTGGTSENSNKTTVTTLALVTKVELTGPATVTAGAVSTAFTVTSQDAEGNAANVTADAKFDLSSNSSGTKVFYSNAAGTSVTTQLTIANGTSAATFYYKDSDKGTPILTAAWNSGGTDLGSDTLPVTVSLATTILKSSTSIASSFKDFKVTVTNIQMDNGTNWITIFSGAAELDLVNGGTFPGISDVALPFGTYSRMKVTFRNSLPVTGTLTYSGTSYYTTTATFGGDSNIAGSPSNNAGSQAVFTFKIEEWGALNENVEKLFPITPITVDASTDYQPTLRFTIRNTFLFKGSAGTASTYYFALSAPTVSLDEP